MLGCLLRCPKTPHNHYGTLPWVPQGTLGPAKSNLLNFHCFPTKFALQSCQNLHGTIMCDPKTRLQGSLRATKCLDASYSVPRHHSITTGPYLGVPKAPWVQQNPNCKIFTIFQPSLPCKTAKTATGPSCATPKPVCGGPCRQPSAWMPPTVSQDTTQSLWDPTLGSPGHPGSGKIQLVKI